MSNDVQQWLAEIRSLQQQLKTAQDEREAAHASADKWRDLYQAEAQQRRTEVELMRDRITELETALTNATAALPNADDNRPARGAVSSPDDLHQHLKEAQAELTRLRAALQDERTNHERTRQNLMTALADTMDLLAREKGDRPISPSRTDSSDRPPSNPSNPSDSPARNPWPELPPLG